MEVFVSNSGEVRTLPFPVVHSYNQADRLATTLVNRVPKVSATISPDVLVKAAFDIAQTVQALNRFVDDNNPKQVMSNRNQIAKLHTKLKPIANFLLRLPKNHDAFKHLDSHIARLSLYMESIKRK